MKEKIKLLRQKIINELKEIPDGLHIKLDYDSSIIELILFDYETDKSNNQRKMFALSRNILSKLDLSNVSFDLLDCQSYDFSNLYGIKIDPQTIYNKDLTNAKLSGVKFIGSFDDTIITGADFTGSINATINPLTLRQTKEERRDPRECLKDYIAFESRVYNKIVDLKKCNFQDVTFIDSFKRVILKPTIYNNYYDIAFDIMGANFTGSKNAKIYTDSLWITGFSNCTLTDVTIIGNFSFTLKYYRYNFDEKESIRSVLVAGADFRGTKTSINSTFMKFKYSDKDKMLNINPGEIVGKDLSNAKFEGIYFTGPFDKVNISNSDFTGSQNAVIDLRNMTPELYQNTNFSNAKVIGFDGKEMYVSSDGRIGTDIESEINKLLNLDTQEAMINKKELENAREKLVEDNRRKVKEKIVELLKIVESSEKLGIEPKNLYCSIPIEQDLFLVPVDNHYEINRNIIDTSLLRFLNLSLIDFTNVNVAGIDLRYSGARINPQKIYQKDLSYASLDNSNVKFYDDFSGVNLEGTNFDECEFRPKEADKFKVNKKTKRSLFHI